MSFDNYKFVLETCASSENEVTGEDIDLEDCFECDLKDVNLKEGVSLFSPKKKEWKHHFSIPLIVLNSRSHMPNRNIAKVSGSDDIAIPTILYS